MTRAWQALGRSWWVLGAIRACSTGLVKKLDGLWTGRSDQVLGKGWLVGREETVGVGEPG